MKKGGNTGNSFRDDSEAALVQVREDASEIEIVSDVGPSKKKPSEVFSAESHLDETLLMDETDGSILMETAPSADTIASGDFISTHANQAEMEGSPHAGNNNEGRQGCSTALFRRDQSLSCSGFCMLVVLSVLPGAIYVAIFTQMGKGVTTYYFLSEKFSANSQTLGAGIMAVLLIFYLLDIDHWKSPTGIFYRRFLLLVLLFVSCVYCLFIADTHPEAPVIALALLNPVWLLGVRAVLFHNHSLNDFIKKVTAPLFVAGFVPLIAFIVWIVLREKSSFTEATQIANAILAACVPNFSGNDGALEYCRGTEGGDSVCFSVENHEFVYESDDCDTNCHGVYDNCSNTLIIWLGPIFVSASLFQLSFCAAFLQSDSAVKDLTNFGKVWGMLLAILWVFLSLNGMSNDMFQAAIYFSVSVFAGSATVLAATLSRDELKEDYFILLKKMTDLFGNWFDVIRGLMLVCFLPVGVFFFFLSVLNQSVRRVGIFPCSKKLDENDHYWLTKNFRKQYLAMQEWDRAKIIVYAVYWGIAYMVLQVVAGQFVVLFLGWLIEEVQGASLVVVTLILMGVGMTLFLLPPVPGVPIYLTLGIVIPAVASETFSLIPAVVYCIVVSLVLKLVACTLQQKLIGEQLSGSVTVRKMVGINSTFVRSMRIVLSDKGFTVAKVAVLVGGPDWPTSVLCGIMKLQLLQILVGTLPVVFLILPTVLTGTFMYLKTDPTYGWASTASIIFIVLTSVVQFGSMVVAGVYLERTSSQRKEEIEQVPIDAEVKALEDAEEEYNRIYADVTRWRVVPVWAKCCLLLSLLTIVIPCYTNTLFLSSSFATFELTSTISEDLNGNVWNFVEPLGWWSLGSFFVSMVFLKVFFSWAKHASNRRATEVSV